jgi:hypothetical protein
LGTHPGSRLACLALLAASVAGTACGRHVVGIPVANLRPVVRVSGGPAPLSDVVYQVRWRWSATDPDGQVVEFQYAIDPVPGADTAWTATTTPEVTLEFPATEPQDPLPPAGQRILARDQHTFVLRVRDNEGAYSEPAIRSFTARTIVPSSVIQSPRPSTLAVPTLPSVHVSWTGFDFDGPASGPVLYRYRVFQAADIDPVNPLYVPATGLQRFLEAQALGGFAGWDSTGSESTSVFLEGLQTGRTYVFAVSAQDEAGAIETRFHPSSNVTQFRPTLEKVGPKITLSNSYFSHTMTGGVSLAPNRIIPLEVPSDTPIPLQWTAVTGQGAQVGGYRWALDMAEGNIADETRRVDDTDYRHWSAWSLDETATTIGPFAGSPDGPVEHFFYVMARDDVGFTSLFTLRLRVVAPNRTRDLLVVDDRHGVFGGPVAPYPVEAEEDTFHFAVGGFPDRLVGGTSQPGAFAGLSYDTLDYRARQLEGGLGYGIPLSLIGRYRAVAWFTDVSSAVLGPGLFHLPEGTALRYMNAPGRMNSLAVYLAQGGKVLLFGEGVPTAISYGFYDHQNRFPPPLPYTAQNVLRAGCFLYDYIHLRSRLSLATQAAEQLRGAIPYLPEFRGPATQDDRTHDPRIGPGAERTAQRWSGLPRLSLANYRGAPTTPSLVFIKQGWTVSLPLNALEGGAPVLDTLYLHQGRDLALGNVNSDGRPDALHYHGAQHGELVWLGFPLHYFERDQARALVHRVMQQFGLPVDFAGAVTRSAPGAGRAPLVRGDP